MGLFNTIHGQASCPNCARRVDVIAQFKFGRVWQLRFEIGESVPWATPAVGYPGREHVVVSAIADSDCPSCGFAGDWDLYLHVQHDRFVRLETSTGEYDLARAPDGFLILR